MRIYDKKQSKPSLIKLLESKDKVINRYIKQVEDNWKMIDKLKIENGALLLKVTNLEKEIKELKAKWMLGEK